MVQRVHVSTLIAVRLVASTFVLGPAILLQLNQPEAFSIDSLLWLIGITYALSAIYVGTLRFVEQRPWLVDAQLGLDAALVTAFVQLTGGIASYFSSLYLLPIITASILRFRRGGLRVAALSALLYLALVAAQYTGAPWASAWQAAVDLPAERFGQYTLAFNICAFFAVALLAGSLAEKARYTGERLANASLAVRDLRAFNQLVLDSLHSGLITADDKCRILTANRAASQITGRHLRDAHGSDACEVLQLPSSFRTSLAQVDERRTIRADVDYETGDGRSIELGVGASMLTLPGRMGFLFSFQDVTAIKQRERDASRQQRLAAVGQMAAGIAHEIRNPLASISGSIQVLRDELPLNEEQAQLLDIVLRESGRLNDTIGSFLDYARPRREGSTRVDVGRLVQDTARLLGNSPEVRADHEVRADVPPHPIEYEADERQIRQVIWNLATNGLRAMAEGGHLVLSVRRESGDRGDILLEVQDSGCGIPPDHLERIFEPFRSTFERGTGLGMAIVHRIVSDHRGTIEIASTVGEGTLVRVRLPLVEGPRASAPATPREAAFAV